MKSITRLSLALIMFSLFSISYLVTSAVSQGMNGCIGAQCTDPNCNPGTAGGAPGYYVPGTAPQLPRGDTLSASGGSYNLNQPSGPGRNQRSHG